MSLLPLMPPLTSFSCHSPTAAATEPCPWLPCAQRFYAIADDTFHPEVRQALALALGPEQGWQPDPIDQVRACVGQVGGWVGVIGGVLWVCAEGHRTTLRVRWT